jgi:small subunit ribosomal protein S16
MHSPVSMRIAVAVRIRLKKMGRKHRPYYRIVAIDARQPRDGRVIEELGVYDTSVKNTEERVKLLPTRIKHWLSVGAKPSEHVAVFLKKYMAKWEQKEAEAAAAKTAAPAEPAAPTA